MPDKFLIVSGTKTPYAVAKMNQGSKWEPVVDQLIPVREIESLSPSQEIGKTVQVLRVLSPLAASYYKMHILHARAMQGLGMSPAPMDSAFFALIDDLMNHPEHTLQK